jgi:hypothetical protein
VFALIGATGVGKTTTTAKIAAAFAARHGAASLGLITLDAYRVGAHEQLRAYGRILGVPVHTAHDRASLEDLLELLTAKKMILIDTAGMAQRDLRTKELLEMLAHRSVQRLLVVNAASQARRSRTCSSPTARRAAPASSSASSTRRSSSARRSTPRSGTASPSSASPTASAFPRTGTACRRMRSCSGRCAAAAAPRGASTPPR